MTSIPKFLADFCVTLPEQRFAPGEHLLREDHASSVLYVLEQGAVEVSKGGVQINAISDPGAIFGEVSTLLGRNPTATVKAVTSCRFRVIENPREFLSRHPGFCLYIAILLARRLDIATNFLLDLRAETNPEDHRREVVDTILNNIFRSQAARERSGHPADGESS
jgi:CRP-like cAMP-binding protein